MRYLIILALTALLVLPAVAQINPPLPDDIVTLGPVSYLGASGSIAPSTITIGGKAKKPSGLILWCKAPFRYTAFFPATGDTLGGATMTAPVDTMYSDVRGDIEYPCVAVLPGAVAASCSISDTLWARPYYRE